jgi:hypothetical protein
VGKPWGQYREKGKTLRGRRKSETGSVREEALVARRGERSSSGRRSVEDERGDVGCQICSIGNEEKVGEGEKAEKTKRGARKCRRRSNSQRRGRRKPRRRKRGNRKRGKRAVERSEEVRGGRKKKKVARKPRGRRRRRGRGKRKKGKRKARERRVAA